MSKFETDLKSCKEMYKRKKYSSKTLNLNRNCVASENLNKVAFVFANSQFFLSS